MSREPNCPLPKPLCPYCKSDRLTHHSSREFAFDDKYRFKCLNCELTSTYYNEFKDYHAFANCNKIYLNVYKYKKMGRGVGKSNFVTLKEWREWAAGYYTESNYQKREWEFLNSIFRDRCRIYNKYHNNIDL